MFASTALACYAVIGTLVIASRDLRAKKNTK